MWALEHAAPSAPPAWLAGTPRLPLAGLAVLALALTAPTGGGALSVAAVRVAGEAALHCTLLATALAWTAWDDGAAAPSPWDPRPAILTLAVLVTLAAALTEIDPRAGVAWLAPGLVYARLAASGRLTGLGLSARGVRAEALAGVALGAALGGHLLLSASLTLDHRLRADGLAVYAAAVAYDVGVNVPASEAFFRGALLRRALAHWSLAGAAAVTTVASVARYLLDPRLPPAAEARVGAVVYLALLGAASAWLVVRAGSLVPALAASATFFAAYRLLGPP
ncbi:MAG: CPBP family glutamic-type intramembrane protease [Candidatus Rokuibacteriota bacterium]